MTTFSFSKIFRAFPSLKLLFIVNVIKFSLSRTFNTPSTFSNLSKASPLIFEALIITLLLGKTELFISSLFP